MNSVMLFLVAVIALLFGAAQLGMRRLGHRAEGRAAPDTRAFDGDARPQSLRVYYFYAPHCGPCRSMTPLIDELRASYPNLIKVDVSHAPEVAQGFYVVATPSFAVVDRGVIQRVFLGVSNKSKILRMLRVDANAD